jgi:pilus assembly protein CpaC
LRHGASVAGRGRRALVIDVLMAGFVAAVLAASVSIGRAQDQALVHVSGAKRTATVYVPAGKSQDVRTDETFVDITIGDPTIADVNPLTDHTLSILGKKNGTTRVSVYGEGKKLVGIFDVEVGYETALIAAELKRRFPQASLKVRSVNGRLLLSGEAPDAPTVDQAVTTVKQFAPDVINSISVTAPQQVMLEVRFIEMSRKAGRDLGVQWNVFARGGQVNIGSRQPAGNLPLNGPANSGVTAAGEVAAGVLSGTSPYGFAIARMINGGTITDLMINALEERGVARSLAEPNLVALSGDTASFLAGGEFPVPVPGSLGQVAIDYKRYGVGLAFTPTVLSRGLINLKIEPEVSQLDTSHPVQVAGISVPPLIVRRASTTVELRDGQSFVIGGLLQNVNTTDQQQVPWVGDVPVLGALFRSASYQKNETDLVIIVTPRLVRPARPTDPIKTPLDNTVPPNDPEFFLLGRNEISRRSARFALGAELPETGHIIDLPKRGPHVESYPH